MNHTPIHPKLAEITGRIIERSRPTREKYLAKIRSAKQMGRLERNQLGCSNLAHGYAAMPKSIKIEMLQETVPNLGIITAYNDMVSAHQPFKDFPDQIKDEAQKNGATAQVAGGTPAMC
ncbi:TPA: phosphogluconate dehydratase, partial [Neisseria gonorrhoeae]